MANLKIKAYATSYIDNDDQISTHNNNKGEYIVGSMYSEILLERIIRYSGYAEFDFTPLAYKKILSVILYQRPYKIDGDMHQGMYNPSFYAKIGRGKPGYEGRVCANITYEDRKITVELSSVRVFGELDLREVVSDITGIFDPNYIQKVTNTEGVDRFYLLFAFEVANWGNYRFARFADPNNPTIDVTYTDALPEPPTINKPVDTGNPAYDISIEWTHNKSLAIAVDDPQIQSELVYWTDIDTNQKIEVIEGTSNKFVIKGGKIQGNVLYFSVRTQTKNNPYGNYSQSQVPLAYQPPLPPTLVDVTSPNHYSKKTDITWQNNPNEIVSDKIVETFIEYWQVPENKNQILVDGNKTTTEIAENTFLEYPFSTVYFHMRSKSEKNGYSEFSQVYSFVLENRPPLTPINLAPNVSQNRKLPIELSWQFVANPDNNSTQVSSQVEFLQEGQTPIVVDITSSNLNAYVIPANTFSYDGHVFFRARTYMIDGFSLWSGYQTFGLAPTPPQEPELKYPVNIKIDASKEIIFDWIYRGTLQGQNDYQALFLLEYWIEGIRQADILLWQQESQTKIPPILKSAVVKWRVKTWNSIGDEGPFSSEATFETIGRPDQPIIMGNTNQNRTTINFTVEKNTAWQMEILVDGKVIFDTLPQPYSLAGAYTLPFFLADGNYGIRMWSISSINRDLVSEVTNYNFTIKAIPKPKKPKLVLTKSQYGHKLAYDYFGYDYVEVYRNNQILSKVQADTFLDYTFDGDIENNYFVRVVSGNNYIDSDVVVSEIFMFCEGLIIGATRSEDIVVVKIVNGSFGWSNSAVIEEQRYFGQSYKTYNSVGFLEENVSFECVVDEINFKVLKSLISQTIFFKHFLTGGFYGVLSSGIQREIGIQRKIRKDNRIRLSLTIERCEYHYVD